MLRLFKICVALGLNVLLDAHPLQHYKQNVQNYSFVATQPNQAALIPEFEHARDLMTAGKTKQIEFSDAISQQHLEALVDDSHAHGVVITMGPHKASKPSRFPAGGDAWNYPIEVRYHAKPGYKFARFAKACMYTNSPMSAHDANAKSWKSTQGTGYVAYDQEPVCKAAHEERGHDPKTALDMCTPKWTFDGPRQYTDTEVLDAPGVTYLAKTGDMRLKAEFILAYYHPTTHSIDWVAKFTMPDLDVTAGH